MKLFGADCFPTVTFDRRSDQPTSHVASDSPGSVNALGPTAHTRRDTMVGIGPRVARLAFCAGIFCAETADSFPDTCGHTGSHGGTRNPTRLHAALISHRGACLSSPVLTSSSSP